MERRGQDEGEEMMRGEGEEEMTGEGEEVR